MSQLKYMIFKDMYMLAEVLLFVQTSILAVPNELSIAFINIG